MAECIVNTEELTSIANAIRSKGETSSSLIYPSGFIAAINSIEINPVILNVSNATTTKISGTTDDYSMTMS